MITKSVRLFWWHKDVDFDTEMEESEKLEPAQKAGRRSEKDARSPVERIFIVGCGAIGRRVAALALEKEIAVVTLARKGLQLPGVKHVVADLDDPGTLGCLPTRNSCVLYLAPPPGGGWEETRMRNFLSSIAPGNEPQKVIYLSTSGVYGDCGGRVVTEATPPNPQTSRGKRRLHAERLATAWGAEHGVAVIVLRVTGIYAPDRLPVTQLTMGQPVLREEEALPTNRIHADDLAQICLAAVHKGENGDIFNVSDGCAGTMTQYFNAAADYLGLPRPPQVSSEEARKLMTPLMISYFSESRVLDNRKMLEKLGVTLLYPNLEAGLKRPH